jgi:hypothetical protein
MYGIDPWGQGWNVGHVTAVALVGLALLTGLWIIVSGGASNRKGRGRGRRRR